MGPVSEISLRRNRSDGGRVSKAFQPVEVAALEGRVVLSAVQTAPWLTYRNEVAAILNHDRGVHVNQLVPTAGGFILEIATILPAEGVGLATTLKPVVNLGGVTVTTVVVNPRGQAYPALKVTNIATARFVEEASFLGNPLVRSVQERSATSSVYPVFTRSVIQFPDGNPSDLHGNFNEVTANVAIDILNGELGQDANGRTIFVYPSTE
jgi:hypothetical protein